MNVLAYVEDPVRERINTSSRTSSCAEAIGGPVYCCRMASRVQYYYMKQHLREPIASSPTGDEATLRPYRERPTSSICIAAMARMVRPKAALFAARLGVPKHGVAQKCVCRHWCMLRDASGEPAS
jgi:hypothetical protein